MIRLKLELILSNDTKQIIEKWIEAVESNNYKPFDHFQLSNPQNELVKILSYKMLDIGTHRVIFDMGKKVLKVVITPIGV